ncbi:MAG TPA: DUF2964 family protein [Trinickia sp.]|jgi:hypothetical protein|uniref:DUF2964 family protein n=1 Tax=Trinickia sp. TaxID=2571163 RepID=UPI002CD8A638|nr:DUF2964 family protein [Trinickia sp.]HTI18042.1 DUF2964 family protein [Trinickia sp.]
MARWEWSVVLAIVATLVAVGGIAVTVRGLLVDQSDIVLYGLAGIVVGIFSCALLLNVSPRDMP